MILIADRVVNGIKTFSLSLAICHDCYFWSGYPRYLSLYLFKIYRLRSFTQLRSPVCPFQFSKSHFLLSSLEIAGKKKTQPECVRNLPAIIPWVAACDAI